MGNRNHHKKFYLLCGTCNRGFIRPQDLREYFVMGKNTGKYNCNKCNKHFPTFTKLAEHLTKQHGHNGKCSLCQELESTEPTGIGYVCCVCDVVFDIPRDLEHHMVNHDSI